MAQDPHSHPDCFGMGMSTGLGFPCNFLHLQWGKDTGGRGAEPFADLAEIFQRGKRSSKTSQVFRGGNPTDFPGTNPCAVSLPAQVAAVGVCAVGASESPSCTMKSCTGNNYICCTSGCFVHPLQLFKSIPCVFTDILSKHLQTLGWQTSTHVNQKLSHNP